MDVGEDLGHIDSLTLLTEMLMFLAHSKEHTSTGGEIWTVLDSIHYSAPQSMEAMRIFLAGETSGITVMLVLTL